MNQSEVAISGRLANQIVRIQPIRRGVTCNTSVSEQYIHFLHFFPFFFLFFIFFIFLNKHENLRMESRNVAIDRKFTKNITKTNN
jgi:hypothetical protein